MKSLAIILCAMLGLGCASQFAGSGIITKPNCQDYANAWAREAKKQGHYHSGVLWYRLEGQFKGHAICWIKDGDETVLIEPQDTPVRRVWLSEYEAAHILNWSRGPSIWGGKSGTLKDVGGP